ncbi:MAG: DUF1475 domain-containing protein [Alphaproteobacteria bacterium]|nr:DUF1475 domain-containing protein [Alphaproteobacteria bacterium]
MTIERWVVALAAALFLALAVHTIVGGAPLDWSAFGADPWVALGMADLTLGFVLMSVIIALVERSVLRAAPWIVALFIVGNLVSAIYLLVNLKRIAPMLRRAREQD